MTVICCLFLCSLVGLRPRKAWRKSVSSGPPQLLDIYKTCKDIRKQYFSASKNSKFNNMGKDSCVAWSCKCGLCYYTWGLNQTFSLPETLSFQLTLRRRSFCRASSPEQVFFVHLCLWTSQSFTGLITPQHWVTHLCKILSVSSVSFTGI